MSNTEHIKASQAYPATAAIVALIVLTGVMLLALMSRTVPHPPLEVPPFALGPFLGASLALGAAALHVLCHDTRYGCVLAILFVITALVSFGPQKYFDPAFTRIWPAMIAAQTASVVLLLWCFSALKRMRGAQPG